VRHRRPGFVAQREHAARVADQHLAVLGGHGVARAAYEQRFAERRFERTDLHAHRGLRAMHERGAAHEAACVGDGDHHREYIEIESLHEREIGLDNGEGR
jgi:hypothetical protein